MAHGELGKFLPKVSFVTFYEDVKSSYYFNRSGFTNFAFYINIQIPIFQAGTEYVSTMKNFKQKKIALLESGFAVQQIETAIKKEYGKYTALLNLFNKIKNTDINIEKSDKLLQQKFDKRDIGKMEFYIKKIDINNIKIQFLTIKYDLYIACFFINLCSLGIFCAN